MYWLKSKYKYILGSACLLSLAIGILNPNPASAFLFENRKNKEESVFTSLSGFQPNTVISYQVSRTDGTLMHGRAQTDEYGNLMIPVPEDMKDYSGDTTYNFVIDQENQSLNIVLKHNSENGSVSIGGSGAGEFTKIVIKGDNKALETRSDWAGLFEEKNIGNLWSADGPGTYKVAFFNVDPGQNIEEHSSPALIQVGGFGGGGVAGGSQADLFDNLITPLQLATEQLIFNAMNHAFIIGTFFDAKEQLETQRDMQRLRAEAVRDYQPSDQMCRIGSFTRSLAHTNQKAEQDSLAFNSIMTTYYQNMRDSSSNLGQKTSATFRLKQFREIYCDPADNDGNLDYMCEHDQDGNLTNSTVRANAPGGIGGSDTERMNRDIDFTRTLNNKYTLDIDFTDNTETDEEEDVIALAKNLYWPSNYSSVDAKKAGKVANSYFNSRRITAINNIAHNSFAKQISLKARAPTRPAGAGGLAGWAYMKTMMREFGLSDDDIVAMIGENPSYYAQMDVLSKRIYQSPNFYTNLYDKTANIDRVHAAMDAISLMQLRDQYDLALRKEMLMSGMVQTDLLPKIEAVQALLHQVQ